jgi:hypothetical protein
MARSLLVLLLATVVIAAIIGGVAEALMGRTSPRLIVLPLVVALSSVLPDARFGIRLARIGVPVFRSPAAEADQPCLKRRSGSAGHKRRTALGLFPTC